MVHGYLTCTSSSRLVGREGWVQRAGLLGSGADQPTAPGFGPAHGAAPGARRAWPQGLKNPAWFPQPLYLTLQPWDVGVDSMSLAAQGKIGGGHLSAWDRVDDPIVSHTCALTPCICLHTHTRALPLPSAWSWTGSSKLQDLAGNSAKPWGMWAPEVGNSGPGSLNSSSAITGLRTQCSCQGPARAELRRAGIKDA